MKFIRLLIAVSLMQINFLPTAHASLQQLVRSHFKPQVVDEGVAMQLKGIGIKNVLLMKAFIAGFYIDGNASASDPLGEISKKIDVKYFVPIPGKKLSNFTINHMKNTTPKKDFENIQDEIKLMQKYFVDLKPGDQFALTYIPNIGTKFLYNGKLQGVVKGEEFAKALFSVWLGPKPFDKRLKEQILGIHPIDQDSRIKFSN